MKLLARESTPASLEIGENEMRLYRGISKQYQPKPLERLDGTDFSDCPLAALDFAKGRNGVLLVLDVTEDSGPKVTEELWFVHGKGPKRMMVWGPFDDFIAAEIPAKELRPKLRRKGILTCSREYKSELLEGYVEDWIRSKSDEQKALSEIQRFIETGDHDPKFWGWPGNDVLEKCRNGSRALEDALIEEVHRRIEGISIPKVEIPPDLVAFTRSKVEPMVRGLFPGKEQEGVLCLLEKSVIFITPDNFEEVIRGVDFLDDAWDLANLYLLSLDVKPLSPDAPRLVGMNLSEKTCVAISYFWEEDPFADFIVHEAAHLLHNCKRDEAGLEKTRTREWLVDIDVSKRETFAHACETYSQILDIGVGPSAWRTLFDECSRGPLPSRKDVDTDEYLDILKEAVRARNGWKRILKRCSPR